jgi:hypothetical protein
MRLDPPLVLVLGNDGIFNGFVNVFDVTLSVYPHRAG